MSKSIVGVRRFYSFLYLKEILTNTSGFILTKLKGLAMTLQITGNDGRGDKRIIKGKQQVGKNKCNNTRIDGAGKEGGAQCI